MTTTPIFISYSHVDLAFVQQLKRDLQAQNIQLWIDHENLQPGTANWAEAIEKGVLACQALIYVASPASKQSGSATHEVLIAHQHNIPIYPLFIEGEDWIKVAPFGMPRLQYIDARANYKTALAQLLLTLTTHAFNANQQVTQKKLSIASQDPNPLIASPENPNMNTKDQIEKEAASRYHIVTLTQEIQSIAGMFIGVIIGGIVGGDLANAIGNGGQDIIKEL